MTHARAYGAVLAAVLLAPAASAEPVGVLDVRELSPAGSLSDLAPGDRADWAVEVTNTGFTPQEVSVAFVVDGGKLAQDPRDGLQLSVELCDSAFTVEQIVDGPRTIQRYLCPADAVPLGSGPAATLGRLDAARPLGGGVTEGVHVRVLFPESAGNEMELAGASLRVIVGTSDAGEGASPGASSGPGPAGGGLAVTGRDLGAALLGGILALGAGTLLAAAGRRRRRERA
ncbi:sortase [Rathayibacter tritici]|uniref:sortase n=1 Tax=Rathayibacter tritici TaxID=33888 RepID=UPI000CE8B5A9|nr:sortase [Rathayibacter tritici]PPF69861.1 sortase [Rathayibacter tritici]PPG09106.1 sortase [Rathayibacter tritici]